MARWNRIAPLLLALCVTVLTAPAHAGLADGLEQIRQGIEKTREQIQQGLEKTMQGFADGLAQASQQISQGLSQGLQQTFAGLQYGATRLRQQYLIPTAGTTAVTDSVAGRPLLIIQPATPSPELAPVIVLLHFSNGTAELMANLTRAAKLAAEQGVWVVLPEGQNKRWKDDPGSSTDADVDFLAQVISEVTAEYAVDPARVYMAGMSNGGFMTARFLCERPELIAAAAIDAAGIRNSLDAVCAPSKGVPVAIFHGTEDIFVPYESPLGLLSVEEQFARWGGFNGCDFAARTEQTLPNTVDDGTSIQLSEVWDCESGGAVRLYSVIGGGHAWPGGMPYVPIPALGRTTQNLDATSEMWSFFSLFTL